MNLRASLRGGWLRRAVAPALALLTIAALGGCGGYVLRGRVVEGPGAGMSLVSADDPQMHAAGSGAYPGIAGAHVAVTRDPGRGSRQLVGEAASAADGSFAIPIDAFGAGWMEEEWLLQAWARGYRTVEHVTPLPLNGGTRLLIVLTPGAAIEPRRPEDLMKEADRFRSP